MISKPGISVIIPFFEARETIERCLNSLITDVFDVEVLLVDDDSSTGCMDIVERYIKDDLLTIKYFRNENNMGAGRSRNRALKEVTKKYLTFLDSDDEFSIDYFKSVKSYIDKNYDVIVYDAKRVFEKSSSIMKMFFTKNMHSGEVVLADAIVFSRGCTCGKIYKTDIIRNFGIEFGETMVNEDLIFTKIAISYSKKIYYIEAPLYIYNDSITSLTNSCNKSKKSYEMASYNIICKSLKNRGYADELNSIFFLEVLYATPNSMMNMGIPYSEIEEVYKSLRSNYDSNDKYRRKYDLKFRFAVCMYNMGLFKLYWFIREKLKEHYTH